MVLAVERNVGSAFEEFVDPCLVAVRNASDVEVLYRPYFTVGWSSGSSRGPTPSGVLLFIAVFINDYLCSSNFLYYLILHLIHFCSSSYACCWSY